MQIIRHKQRIGNHQFDKYTLRANGYSSALSCLMYDFAAIAYGITAATKKARHTTFSCPRLINLNNGIALLGQNIRTSQW